MLIPIFLKDDSVPPVMIMLTGINLTIYHMVQNVLHEHGCAAGVTSGCEGKHRRESAHYYNMALDFRITWQKQSEKLVLEALKKALPAGYRYYRESDHLHVERFSGPYPWTQ